MTIRVHITDGLGKNNKASVSNGGFLRVDTKPYYEYTNALRYLVSDEYGRNMNVNAAPSASLVENIHNGEDNTYWTASTIVGQPSDFVFSSIDQNHTDGGAQSFYYNAEDGETAQFTRGSDLDLTDYDTLSGWFYITDWDTINQQILFYGYDTGTGTIVGNSVNLGDYININDQDTWQPFTITLSALGLVGQTIDAIRTEVIDGGGNPPTGYLDDLQLIGLVSSDIPSPVRYILKPNQGELLVVETLNFTFVKEYDSTIANGTSYGISYNDILGFEPDNGIFYRRYSNEVLEFNVILKSLFDLVSLPDLNITNVTYDGTYTMVKLTYKFIEGAILRDSLKDYIELRLSDDFSVFQQFRSTAGCRSRMENYKP